MMIGGKTTMSLLLHLLVGYLDCLKIGCRAAVIAVTPASTLAPGSARR